MRSLALLLLTIGVAAAHDDGRYADSALKPWFDKLASQKGSLCCSFADGRSVADPDWGTHDGSYWVVIDGVRYKVPDDAVVTVPNKLGTAVVWPYDSGGVTLIRCFMPGSET